MTKEEFRANLYTALVATTQNPVVIQEQIKIAEEFVFSSAVVSTERLNAMHQTVKVVCDNTLVGVETNKKRQDLLQTVLNDPMHQQLRAYKSQLLSYSENNKRDPVNALLEDLFSIL
ncbi:hypothetical protein N5J31_08675 [Acinetobacter johnsonii]|uniref:hypothetical protein n=1 Tax=Acinetobacter johnsonii TaxID=40214 RepID=UPI002447792B|nr:hypothetical protein [Acinetobacter johnsonii]MDH2046977.1 hypothetical protein [Acinetobacter johnsonii]